MPVIWPFDVLKLKPAGNPGLIDQLVGVPVSIVGDQVLIAEFTRYVLLFGIYVIVGPSRSTSRFTVVLPLPPALVAVMV